jgi:hypothetical protein
MATGKKSEKINGGARPGAGRKPGSPNKKTAEVQKAVAESGITPLEFMLEVMRKEPDPSLEPREFLTAATLRFEAAKAAAPYVHAKLSSIEMGGKDGAPIASATEITFKIVRPSGNSAD